ncbi:MAG: NAD(P)/FAD-dependent oxidoreductase [Candidatus Omnitrophota bacterium]|jgi:prolycopene isomerase
MTYDTIIIGAGVGGLACALKLSSCGKKVLLLERQPIPGGCATTFTRKGFTFEASMHCVNSLGEGLELRNFLEDLGVDKKVNFIKLASFCRTIYPEHDFVVDFSQDIFFNYLKEQFPAERDNLEKLISSITKFYKQFDGFCISKLPSVLQLLISPFFYPDIIKISSLSACEFLDKYIKDKKLKSLISDLWKFVGVPPSRLSALYLLVILRGYCFDKTCYVQGGYMQLFKAIVDKIRANGSEVRYNTFVAKILIEKNRVKGVVTDKKEEITANSVISNANAPLTLGEMIDNVSLKENYKKQIARLEKSISVFQVYLGLSVSPKSLGMKSFMLSINNGYDHDESFDCSIRGDYDNCIIEAVDHSQLDPSLAPQGKGTLLIMTLDSYDNWKDLTGTAYQEKKKQLAQKLIERCEKYLPGLSKHIEIMEVATPNTMYRYTLTPEGAIYGFAHTVMQSGIFRLDQKTKIKGLYLAGAWTRPGAGVHACFISGLDAAELTLKYLR